MLRNRFVELTSCALFAIPAACGRAHAPLQRASVDAGQSFDSIALQELRQGQLEKARALYNKVLVRSPRSLAALTGVGDTYALQGHYAAAKRAYERLLSESGSTADSIQALLRIGEAMTFGGDVRGAEAVILPGIQLARSANDAGLEYAIVSRINALQRWNNQLVEAEETIAEMERVGTQASFPEAIRVANVLRSRQLLAMIHAKRGNSVSAKREAEEYVQRREHAGLSSQREMTLGLVATYLGEHADAIRYLERAPETQSMSYLQYWLGVAHEALGHEAIARSYFERVAEWRGLGPVDRLQLPLVRDLAKRRLSATR